MLLRVEIEEWVCFKQNVRGEELLHSDHIF